MILQDIIDIIEAFAPLSLAEPYDNCGLLIGDAREGAAGTLVTLDVNAEVVEEAKSKGCNLILAHHPFIFGPIKKIDYSLPQGEIVRLAANYNISIYAAHTNVDKTDGGLNDFFMEKLGLENIRRIEDFDGRLGEVPSRATLAKFSSEAAEILKDRRLFFVGDPAKIIKTVAGINGGGGSQENILAARAAGADVFISADFKYGPIRLANDAAYAIISCGHYESEIFFVELLSALLEKRGVKVYKAENCHNPLPGSGK
jgi:dinuclear metal center protein, YbgI/SA1388 family